MVAESVFFTTEAQRTQSFTERNLKKTSVGLCVLCASVVKISFVILFPILLAALPLHADDLADMAKRVRAGEMSAQELSRVVILRAEAGEIAHSNPERLVLVVPGFAQIIGEALIERSVDHYRSGSSSEANALLQLSRQMLGAGSIYTERLTKFATLEERLNQLRLQATKEELLAFETNLVSNAEKELFLPTVKRLLAKLQTVPVKKPVEKVEQPKKVIKTVKQEIPQIKKSAIPWVPIVSILVVAGAVVGILLYFLTPHVPFLSHLSGSSAERLEEARQDWIKHRAKKRGVGYAEVVEADDEYSKLLAEFGLDDSASESDIKKAFRNLVKELHPDAHGSSGQVTDEEGNVDRSFDELKKNYERLIEMRKSFFGRD